MTDANNSTPTDLADRTLVVERTFNAPRDLVWQAWTAPKHIEKWWGPHGWATTVYKMDVRPGGVWHYCMRGPEDAESWGLGTYSEVNAPGRLSYDDAFSDKDGNISPNMPVTSIVLDFIEQDGKTRLVSTSVFDSPETLESLKGMGMMEGLNETWDRLQEHVEA